jgi:Cu-Zn family superoxide dismutase
MDSKRAIVIALALGATLLVPLGGAGVRAGAQSAKAVLRDASGGDVGVAHLTQVGDAVRVRAETRGLSPGFHAFHVHAVGECVPPFTSAGGHYNPGGTGHGAHAGDLPSLLVMEDGTAWLRFETDAFTVEELFDADGSAIIVHAGRDNFANIPTRYHSHTEDTFGPDSVTLATGDAGARTACGVLG